MKNRSCICKSGFFVILYKKEIDFSMSGEKTIIERMLQLCCY